MYKRQTGLIMVATDRISAFDHILKNKITDKGAILTQTVSYTHLDVYKRQSYMIYNCLLLAAGKCELQQLIKCSRDYNKVQYLKLSLIHI